MISFKSENNFCISIAITVPTKTSVELSAPLTCDLQTTKAVSPAPSGELVTASDKEQSHGAKSRLGLHLCSTEVHKVYKAKGSRNIRKSAKVVTMLLKAPPPCVS